MLLSLSTDLLNPSRSSVRLGKQVRRAFTQSARTLMHAFGIVRNRRIARNFASSYTDHKLKNFPKIGHCGNLMEINVEAEYGFDQVLFNKIRTQ